MQFNATTNRDGIIQEFERLTGLGVGTVSGDTNKLKDATVYANNVLHELWPDIFFNSGRWQYDDSNQTDLPQGTVNMVSGTSKYALPIGALTVRRIDIKTSEGNWTELQQITDSKIEGGLEEFLETDGTPRYYRLQGDMVELFPGPNYASTAGLKVFFDRGAVEFANDDTTQTPGFPSEFHAIVPIDMAIQWYSIEQPNSGTLPILIQRRELLRSKLIKYYQTRTGINKPTINRRKEYYS